MGSLIVARSRNQWGSIVVDVGCPCDAWRAVLSTLKWLAFCIIRGRVFNPICIGETGFLDPETDRPKSPSGQKWSPRRRKRSRKSPPRVASVLRDYGLNERAEAPADSKALHDEGGVTW